jgi:hypothetical protein
MKLRDVQALALLELGTEGGLFGAIRVGAGKTLISLLAPVVTFAERPLLLVPAKLVDKTLRDWRALAEHWILPAPRTVSYEWLGRAQAADALKEIAPDLIVADEAHKLKNPRAAVTRRVRRWMAEHPKTKFVAMSGTITKRSLHDYAHLLLWSLGAAKAPLPMNFGDLEMWADALDERKGQVRRTDPGALRVLCDDEESSQWDQDARGTARRAFRRRLVDTPGVVATKETPIDASITISAIEPNECSETDEAFYVLRSQWRTPDGWPIADAMTLTRHARELALGFYYVWDPRPPRDWLEARATWCAYVRQVLKHSRLLDSELQVRRKYEGSRECQDWIAVRDTFEPNTVSRWFSHEALYLAASWVRSDGIIWTEHRCFGKRLSEIAGIPYFGRGGLDVHGNSIEDHKPGYPMICSVQSNAEGRNLQAWNQNLVVSPSSNGGVWEQLLGRTHRDGQKADEIIVDVLVACAEHTAALHQAVNDARYVRYSTGTPQKLLLADIDVPHTAFRSGARWEKTGDM